MDYRRNDEWEDDYEVYSPNQVEGVLNRCGIEVVSDTFTHLLGYCPFHGNSDTPAFQVNKTKGLWNCFNPSCDEKGKLTALPRRLLGMNEFQAHRLIIKCRSDQSETLMDRLTASLEKEPDLPEFPQATIDRMVADFPGSVGEKYMLSRGFEKDTLSIFEVGYSAQRDMVTVPMHDGGGRPLGIIGRTPSHEVKQFKNSVNLPKSKTAWNFHRAKRGGDTIIICEASYDAMRIHQAGYPNVVALLGGHVSPLHVAQLGRSFSKVILMTDFDPKQYRPNCRMCHYEKCVGHRPGRDLGRSIAGQMVGKKILWAAYDETCVFPHDAKDASDLTDDEIRQCLSGAVSNLVYSQWDIEELVKTA